VEVVFPGVCFWRTRDQEKTGSGRGFNQELRVNGPHPDLVGATSSRRYQTHQKEFISSKKDPKMSTAAKAPVPEHIRELVSFLNDRNQKVCDSSVTLAGPYSRPGG
jgi:hypothetical protein